MGYWTTRGYANSRTGRLADWTSRGCHRRLCVLSFRSFGGICEIASCPVRELAYPRVVQLPMNAGHRRTRCRGERARLPAATWRPCAVTKASLSGWHGVVGTAEGMTDGLATGEWVTVAPVPVTGEWRPVCIRQIDRVNYFWLCHDDSVVNISVDIIGPHHSTAYRCGLLLQTE